MSGIAGIYNLDGRPVDSQLLTRMTDSLAFRGPDALQVWNRGSVGFGHTLLRTTDESTDEHQPLSFDNQIWIVADARIDGREDLVRKLNANGRNASLLKPDVELILHAYHVWGEACVEHLLGDFAFAIWDERERRLFCARDHFGVKPFFYSPVGDCLVFSNTLDCVRLHPAVSDELNEQFIADFLLFDVSQDESVTVFADVLRLPPAHCLTCSVDGLRVRKFWILPEPSLVYRKHPGAFIEQFNELFDRAVADRLRTRNISVQMSGGLDSTAVAAVAHRFLTKRTDGFDLRAYTIIFNRLFADDEGEYAQMVADDLCIPIRYHVADDYLPFAHFDRPEIRMPEPWNEPAMEMAYDQYLQMAENSRVVLTGTDGDTVLQELPNLYFKHLFKNGGFGKLLAGMWWFVRVKGQPPRIGLRGAWRKWRNPESSDYEMPVWINQDFARRMDLAGRLREINETGQQHPFRPRACRVMRSSLFSQVLEPLDPGLTSVPIEWRHPFADLRLVEFLLTVPPVPWLVEKELLKLAMRGQLPEPVIQRPKTPLAIDPLIEELHHGNIGWTMNAANLPELDCYVDCRKIPALVGETDNGALWSNLRPMGLNYWLTALNSANPKQELEEKHEYGNKYAAAAPAG